MKNNLGGLIPQRTCKEKIIKPIRHKKECKRYKRGLFAHGITNDRKTGHISSFSAI